MSSICAIFANMIDRQTIDRIMEATNIVEVVSEFVTLKKRGVNYIGLCPFHDDSHPSFSVSPSKGICHCFSCGKGGNAVNFLMELEQMSYPDALRWLANKYHIEIKERERTDEEKLAESQRESMLILNEWAACYYHNVLLNETDGKAIGMEYFRSRGFRDDIIEKFKLGFSLRQREALASAALKQGYQKEFLVKTGLCVERENGELVDRFYGRAMFPWMSVSGKVIAFGGRVLDSRTKGVSQKYVNSPDSEIYHKEQALYGIYQAKKAIAKEDCVYMVEGYTDVISMHQCGIENVVANSGTALSVKQIRMLHRFTNNIVLLYDGDEAGIHAALRGTDMLLAEGMNIKVLLLPDGNDPDSFARTHTASDFRNYIEEHQTDFIRFKTQVLMDGVTDPIKRSEAINDIMRSVSMIQDQIVRATYIRECSERLSMSEATLISAVNRFITQGKDEKEKAERRVAGLKETPAQVQSAPTPGMPQAPKQGMDTETMLIQAVIRYGERIISVRDCEDNAVSLALAQYVALNLASDNLHFTSPLYERVLKEANDHLLEEGFHTESYFVNHPDPEVSKLASELCAELGHLSPSLRYEQTPERLRQLTEKLVMEFRYTYAERKVNELYQQVLACQESPDQMAALMAQYNDMKLIKKYYAEQLGKTI